MKSNKIWINGTYIFRDFLTLLTIIVNYKGCILVKDIITYPDKTINITSPDLRSFDDTLFKLLEDMKDTLEAHKVKGLAAIQIGVPMSVIVIKQDDGTYLEIINPRIIGKEGSVESIEETLYFPNIKHTITRYKKIRLIYQDIKGEQKALKAEGDLAIILQRKIDYLFGDTLATRSGFNGQKKLEKELAQQGIQGSFESCPTVFMKDYFTSVMQKVLFFMGLTLFAPLFNFEKETIVSMWNFDKYATGAIFLLIIGYFIVGIQEGKKYTSCTSCQIGNLIGTAVKYTIATIVIATAAYFLLS
jgi:peptide deformylase